MRTEKEIGDRLRALRWRFVRSCYTRFLSNNTCNCSHSFLTKSGYLCAEKLRLERCVFFCNDEVAGSCSLFNCKYSKEEVRRNALQVLESPEKMGGFCPEILALDWVVGESDPEADVAELEDEKSGNWFLRLARRLYGR